MTLDEMKPGEGCEIVDILADGVLGQRLVDMGFTPGTRIRVVHNAALLDPMELEMKGYKISPHHSGANGLNFEFAILSEINHPIFWGRKLEHFKILRGSKHK